MDTITIIDVPAGVWHKDTVWSADTSGAAGLMCELTTTSGNASGPDPSENDNVVSLWTGDYMVHQMAIEDGPGQNSRSSVAPMAPETQLRLHLGENGVSSADFRVTMACPDRPEPPHATTTTVAATTTTVAATTTTATPTTTTTEAVCHEDEDCWDCETMGNQECGPTTTTTTVATDDTSTSGSSTTTAAPEPTATTATTTEVVPIPTGVPTGYGDGGGPNMLAIIMILALIAVLVTAFVVNRVQAHRSN
jgi:hypothetical protein